MAQLQLKQFRDTRYYAGSDGFVYSKRKNGSYLKLADRLSGCGYRAHQIRFNGTLKGVFAHHIIIESFSNIRYDAMIARKFEVMHLDSNKLNNTPGNLKWGTRSMNVADNKWRDSAWHNADRRLCRWTDDEIRECKQLLKEGFSFKDVIKRTGMPTITVYRIRKGIGRYADVTID